MVILRRVKPADSMGAGDVVRPEGSDGIAGPPTLAARTPESERHAEATASAAIIPARGQSASPPERRPNGFAVLLRGRVPQSKRTSQGDRAGSNCVLGRSREVFVDRLDLSDVEGDQCHMPGIIPVFIAGRGEREFGAGRGPTRMIDVDRKRGDL